VLRSLSRKVRAGSDPMNILRNAADAAFITLAAATASHAAGWAKVPVPDHAAPLAAAAVAAYLIARVAPLIGRASASSRRDRYRYS